MLHLPQAAEELTISVSTLRRLIADGEIAVVPVGMGKSRQHIRIAPAEIERFKEARACRFTNIETPKPTATISSTAEFDFLALRTRRQKEKLAKSKRG